MLARRAQSKKCHSVMQPSLAVRACGRVHVRVNAGEREREIGGVAGGGALLPHRQTDG